MTATTSFQTLFAKINRDENEYFSTVCAHILPYEHIKIQMDGVQSVLSFLLFSAVYPSL